MRFISQFTALSLAPLACAIDVTSTVFVEAIETSVYQWDANYNPDIQIHSSCNRTQYLQLFQAWEETKIMAKQARDHTAIHGNSSEIYNKYFNHYPTADVIGWFHAILEQDKTGVLFRCDDIDQNCHQAGWAGHWRGSNATDETVICDLSYETRRHLTQMCALGYDVSTSANNLFWSSDLLHRLWHTDIVGQKVVDHYADTYEDCLELALTDPDEAVMNSASLRFYALEVYAYDIALPGVGCASGASEESSSDVAESSSTTSDTSTATVTSGTECHTHANGVVHCS